MLIGMDVERCGARVVRLLAVLSVLLSGTLGGAQTSTKTLLSSSTALYARVVRMSHSSNSALNGRIVASVTAFVSGVGEEDIYASSDGTSFAKIGAVTDSDFAGGLCCGTLYELPSKVGSLPAGTLIYSGSVGQGSTTAAMKIKVYASQDGGATWSYLSTPAVTTKPGTTGGGLWEPQFTIATDGALVVVYSDETVSGHSQLLKQMRSYDGATWQDAAYTVALSSQSGRPGMAIINTLPGGLYFMTYEVCGTSSCMAYYRTSADGWNWGDALNVGTKIVSTTGQYFEHAPTNVWAAASSNPNGTILVTGQMLYESNGSVSSGNGKTIFVNHSADGSGTWTTMTAPVAVPTAYDNYCPNYSSPLLPSTDGTSVLEFASDYVGSTCVMYYASGTITGGAATSTVQVTPAQTTVTSLPMNVTVNVSGAQGTATGTVTLATGSWTSAATSLTNGSATIALPAGSLTATSVTLTATYSGDANYATASGTSNITVNTTVLPGLKVAASDVTVSTGATSGNTSTVTVTPQQGFTGTVTLTAALSTQPSGATVLPSLSFAGGSTVAVSGTSAVTSVLTVSTTKASTVGSTQPQRIRPWLPVGFVSLGSLLLLHGRLRGAARRLSALLVLLACVSMLPGCGGASSTGSTKVTTPGTSTGSYVVTVTATSGSTSATTTMNLVVN